IQELESRLEKCRQRLGTIGNDRKRVMEIKQRYSGGPFYDRQVTASASSPTPASGVGQAVSMAVAAAMNKEIKSDLLPQPPKTGPVQPPVQTAPPVQVAEPVAPPEPPKPVSAPPEPPKPVSPPPEPPKPVSAPPEPPKPVAQAEAPSEVRS